MKRRSSLKRKENLRAPKRKFISYCEGENTEPQYLKALKQSLSGAIIDIEVVGGAGVPATIASVAINALSEIRHASRKSRQSFGQLDEVWAVFDEDIHPNVLQAINQCKSAGVGIAYSNPCFELWLVLHRQNFDQACDRHQIQKYLEEICPEYNRKSGKSVNCVELIKTVEDAECRAILQLQRREDEASPMGAPSTTVQELTKALRIASASFVLG